MIKGIEEKVERLEAEVAELTEEVKDLKYLTAALAEVLIEKNIVTQKYLLKVKYDCERTLENHAIMNMLREPDGKRN